MFEIRIEKENKFYLFYKNNPIYNVFSLSRISDMGAFDLERHLLENHNNYFLHMWGGFHFLDHDHAQEFIDWVESSMVMNKLTE